MFDRICAALTFRLSVGCALLAASCGSFAASHMEQYLHNSTNPPFTGKFLDLQESGDGYSGIWENCNASRQCASHPVTISLHDDGTITITEGPQAWNGNYKKAGNKITFEATCAQFDARGVIDIPA